MARKSTAHPRHEALHQFRLAIVRVLLEGALGLACVHAGAVSRRRLVNLLRGSQAPQAGEEDALHGLFGQLAACSANWLHDVAASLIEEGLLTVVHTPRGGCGLTTDAGTLKALEEDRVEVDGLFPVRPRLGMNPEVEARLCRVRADLARKEGRAPYGIFPNAALAELSARRPRTLADLAQVPGLGAARVRKYGRRILSALGRD